MRNIGIETKDAVLQTPIAKSIQTGTLKIEAYRRYMADVYCYAIQSSKVIAVAGSRLIISHPPLAEYLLEHSREELGHDRWAKQDLLDLGLTEFNVSELQPSDPCLKMLAMEHYFAYHDNPIGLFGWMLALEGLGGAIGGSIAKGIDSCLNISGKGTYFLTGHGEADNHHSQDLMNITQKHIVKPEDVALVRKIGCLSRQFYVEILQNCLVHPIEIDSSTPCAAVANA